MIVVKTGHTELCRLEALIIVTEARPDENVRQQANCYLQAGRGLYDNCDVNRARRERETAG